MQHFVPIGPKAREGCIDLQRFHPPLPSDGLGQAPGPVIRKGKGPSG